MARQPKKASKDFVECPKCKSTFLDVTPIYNGTELYNKEYDCRECEYAWDSFGNEL